ncbi:hypothetical protein [Pseudonocardia sp. ICBG162]|uniref:hypothetical protein n=1 Tax=Pseudonocardia sp. ICBG162 TaxID=2846761 RepID=UPI001CF66DAC|nr:hypothetical protein [Pseudonocardia sp. ICBG162]
MRTATWLSALALVVVAGAPLTACSTGPERQVCGVLEADGDDYLEVDPAACPAPEAVVSPAGPRWVPVSALDDDDHDHDHHRTVVARSPGTPRTTAARTPAPRATATPRTTTRTTTKTTSPKRTTRAR